MLAMKTRCRLRTDYILKRLYTKKAHAHNAHTFPVDPEADLAASLASPSILATFPIVAGIMVVLCQLPLVK